LQTWEFIPTCIVGRIYILDMYNTGEYFCKGTHWNCLDDINFHPHTFPVLLEGGVTVTNTHSVRVYVTGIK